jgi:Tol biopolymer transport system component
MLSRRDWLRRGLAAGGALVLSASRPARAGTAKTGTIYTMAMLDQGAGGRKSGFIGVDPETGEWSKILDACDTRPRVSPDGRTVAFSRDGALWTAPVAGGAEPRRVLDLEGATGGSPAVWSGDGTQFLISLASRDPEDKRWVFKTVRTNADGTGRKEAPIPAEDLVHDWSPDGDWVVTSSHRNAKIGWELYVMRPDGREIRQITEGGNPFYARFSPDGRRVLYSDGTTEERRGIWVVGRDGQGRRKVFATGDAIVSPCWSPDGTRIAIGIRDLENRRNGPWESRIEIMDLDAEHRASLSLTEAIPDMPDWR